MPDFAADVSAGAPAINPLSLPAWQDIEREFEAGDIPHCRAVSAPQPWHAAILERMARLTLGLGPDAPSPVEAGHPDLLIAGDAGTAPDIDTCRSLIRGLELKPLSATRRLGVVMAADRLLLPAANSLLKLAEEPPSYACILFILEGNRLLPTLRSRARFTVLTVPPDMNGAQTGANALTGSPPPGSDAEWLSWIEGARTKDAAAIALDLADWAAYFLDKKDFGKAAGLERLRLISETKNLSAAMLCDFLILALREGLPFEHLFGDFW